jgi:GNAT superfamily N-acetyltransferase
MEIQILPMTAGHAADVQKLSEQLGYPLSLTDIESNIKEVITANSHAAFVALHNEKIVGWIHAFRCTLLESNPFIEIGGLVVDEGYRGKGIGKKLIASIKEWSLQKGFQEIRVRSHVKRKEAHKFYTGIGFKESKEQKVFEMKL